MDEGFWRYVTFYFKCRLQVLETKMHVERSQSLIKGVLFLCWKSEPLDVKLLRGVFPVGGFAQKFSHLSCLPKRSVPLRGPWAGVSGGRRGERV